MASFIRDSKFRNTVTTLTPREQWYEQLKVGDVSTSSDGNGITASSAFLAYVDNAGGGSCIGVLPLSSVGKNHVPVSAPAYQQPLLRAHSQAVQDLAFLPHHRNRLLSCAGDGSMKLWTVPGAGYVVDCSTPTSVFTPSIGVPLRGLAVHPTSSEVVAVRGVKDAFVVDLASGTERVTIPAAALGDTELNSMTWSFMGDLLVFTGKDKQLKLWDPRSASLAASCQAHAGLRGSKSTWLGDSNYLFTAGVSGVQDREIALWDSRKLDTVVKRERVDSNRGSLLPFYDADSGLLVLAGKGDVTMRLYEFDSSRSSIFGISNASVGEPTKGACMLPKQANNLMSCEVIRMLKVVENMIQPVSLTVPRKERLKYHEDLFPPTHCEAPQALTAEQWFEGASATPNKVAIPPPAGATVATEAASDSSSSSASEATHSSSEAVAASADGAHDEAHSASGGNRVSVARSTLTAQGGSTMFKHLYAVENPKASTYFNIRPNVGTSESPMIACSDKFWAIPWNGTGGPIYVSKHDSFGKVEPTCNLIDGHRAPLQDLAFSPFHSDILVSASDDCKVKVWKVPDEGLTGGNMLENDALGTIHAHNNGVRTCNFHPTVSGLLLTTSYDSVKLWDIDNNCCAIREIGSQNTGFADLGSAISNVSFNYDGSLFAVSCRDRAIRIVDVRSSLATVHTVGHHELFKSSLATPNLGRNLRVAWCANGSLDVLLTVSASVVNGARQVMLWDPRHLKEPTCIRGIDNAAGALFPTFDPDTNICYVAGRGDTSIRFFDIAAINNEPSNGLCNLLNHTPPASSPISGYCLLPKKACDVRNIEVTRLLKLTGDAVVPVKFFLPRADHLKKYFQDDVFPATKHAPTMSCAHWSENADASTAPVLQSLRPDDMELLSAYREQAVASVPSKSKISSFRDDIAKKEEENKKKEAAFDKMQQLALQRAQYHPNLSGGGSHPSSSASGAPAEDKDVNDDEWDD